MMPTDSKNVQTAKKAGGSSAGTLGVKHLTLRLPAAPDFKGLEDESAGLTRLRAMSELLTGERLTIHALLVMVIESAEAGEIELPVPKADTIPTGSSVERIDVRVNQAQIQMLDALRGRIKPHDDILDIREYYGRVDVLRQLLLFEHDRVDKLFRRKMKAKLEKRQA